MCCASLSRLCKADGQEGEGYSGRGGCPVALWAFALCRPHGHAPWPGAEVPPVFLQILRRLQGMEEGPLPGRAAPSMMPVISSVRARSMMELGLA